MAINRFVSSLKIKLGPVSVRIVAICFMGIFVPFMEGTIRFPISFSDLRYSDKKRILMSNFRSPSYNWLAVCPPMAIEITASASAVWIPYKSIFCWSSSIRSSGCPKFLMIPKSSIPFTFDSTL